MENDRERKKPRELSVLVVEDHSGYIQAYASPLIDNEINRFDCAMNLDSAMRYVDERQYDIILSDTNGPCEEPMGPLVAERVRKASPSTKIVALSSDENMQKLWPEGSYDYFVKKELINSGLYGVLHKIIRGETK